MPPRTTDSAPSRPRRRKRRPASGAGADAPQADGQNPQKWRKSRKPRSAGQGDRGYRGRRSRPLTGPSLFDACTRRNAILLWFGAALLLAALCVYPVSSSATRGGSLVLAIGLLAGLLGLWWRYAVLRWSLLAVVALLTGYWFLPGRTTFDRPLLRQEVARAMRRFHGVKVHEGGENRYGVDSAGIIRRGLIEATARHGVRTLNPWLLRRSATFWWNDFENRDLLRGAGGTARRYAKARSLAALNEAVLYPGDYAVTADARYALVYLGDSLWMMADPDGGHVILADPRKTRHPALELPVSHFRWRILEAPRAILPYHP